VIMAPAEPTTSKWSKRQLSELLVVQNGFAFSSKKFSTTDGTPLIRIRDLNPGTGTKTRYLGEFDEQFLVHKGDLLIGMDGEFRCNIWKGPDALLNQRVCRLQNFSSDLIPKFLFYGINKYLKEIEDVTGFTTVKHLSSKSIKEIKFPVPPLAEQERIVGILDEAFEGIAAATAQAEKNLHNARELLQSVLQSTFFQKGDDWVETTLGEVCELISGQHILAGDYNTVQKGIGYLTGPSDFGELNPIVSRWTEKPKSTAKSDDILITVKGSGVGKINLLAEEEIAISRQLMAIRLNDTVSLKFIYFFMSMQFAFFQDLSTGAAIPGISRKDVLNLVLNLPPLPTQQAIVEKLDALSEQTKALEAIYERKQSALAELKQSLLQKAFAGEL
jgi:type I restriction enzyme, S subunit